MEQESYKSQIIISGEDCITGIADILKQNEKKSVLVVTSESSVQRYGGDFLRNYNGRKTFFYGFSSNPKYEEVEEGLKVFQQAGCDAVLSVGGGSAIDVAKNIKAFFGMDSEKNFFEQKKEPNEILHIAVPTTAGTGSESSCFSVVYYKGEKKSVEDPSMLPDYAVLCPVFLKSLSFYQKKATVMDALCQGIESYWSVNATAESRRYAKMAIQGMLTYIWDYLEQSSSLDKIMWSANYAGRAINISKTTAAHAMSYKITSMYQFAHGHAVGICLPVTWRHMNGYLKTHTEGYGSLMSLLQELSIIMGCTDTEDAVAAFEDVLKKMQMEYPTRKSDTDIQILAESVNVERLNNFPIPVSKAELKTMYEQIVR